MKFGKEFASQMVPEWKEAYLDYAFLKTHLKEIQMFKQKNELPTARANSLKRSMTLYRAFSGLTHLARHAPTHHHHPHHHHHHEAHDIENQVILVNSTRRDGTEGSETMFLNAADEGGEYELMFFKRLDDEFNKVLKFFRSKASIVMEEAEELNKQMDALIAFRVKVENPNGWANVTVEETSRLAAEVEASTAALHLNSPSVGRDNSSSRRVEHMNVIDEENSVTMRHLARESNDGSDEEDGQEMKPVDLTPSSSNIELSNVQSKAKSKRPAHLDVLNQVKFNKNVDTPRSTIKGVLKLPIQTDLKFSKDNLRKAEEQLKKAFVEFYNKLKLLKSYSFLNLMAISKIMKKYDKIASRNAAKAYMKMVDNSYLGTSEEVNRLMERVEATFIKHFANSNRSKGMNILRPRHKRERHRITFSTGFLVGCTVSLLLALILVIRARNILEQTGTEVYMDTMFPLYSLFGFIVLHMLTYAACIYFWRKYRVNYAFILNYKQGTELGYKEVLLISFSISVLALASVLANLDMEMNPQTRDYQSLTELLPLGLLVLLIAILICPLNIIYRSSRYVFLITLCHCVLAPLYKVTLPDFLLADQFTSQVQALRDIEFYICYYGWGDYRHRENSCNSSHVFNTFSFVLGGLPFWWRTLQCLRRWIEEKDNIQGYNSIKYFMTIVAVCCRTAYTLNGAVGWLIAAWINSVIAAILHVYWDIILDWGLLDRNSKNKWLRDKLLVPYKSVYFVAIVSDVVLRLAWIQSVLNISFGSLHTQTMLTIMACLEIIRRGVWNFFRVENEHLNNIGKYRAFKSVPMPFNYDEDDDKDN